MKGYLTIPDAAAHCGVGYRTIYNAVRSGKLTAYRPGLHILIPEAALADWFESTRVQPRKRLGRPRTNGPEATRRPPRR